MKIINNEELIINNRNGSAAAVQEEVNSRRALLRLPMRVVEVVQMDSRLRGNDETLLTADRGGSAVGDSGFRRNDDEQKTDSGFRRNDEEMNGNDGKKHWRSLDELKGTEEFQSFQTREFQPGASELEDPVSRRQFLSLMGASVALAGLAGCRKPVEKIVPYVKTPEETVIGRPEQYATSAVIAGSVAGLLVTSRDGRPIKIEGNPLHPASLGGTTVFQQASILGLYDQDRSKKVLNRGVESDWESFVDFWREGIAPLKVDGGGGMAVISETISSPTMKRLKEEFKKSFASAIWVEYDPVSDSNVLSGLKWALGGDYAPIYDYSKPKVVVSLDADFLNLEGDVAANTRQFAEGRRITNERSEMNRLYVVESNFSLTGATADHRLRARSADIGTIAAALGSELTRLGVNVPMHVTAGELSEKGSKFVKALAKDLVAHVGESLVVGGWSLPPAVHMMVTAINEALGNVGHGVSYVSSTSTSETRLQKLTDAIGSGKIETLIVLGGNPVHTAGNFAELLGSKVKHVIRLGDHFDETSKDAEWHLPRSHFLESWGDSQATDGTFGIQQPLIEPLFHSKSDIELIGMLMTGVEVRGYDLTRETWKNYLPVPGFEKSWRQVLHDGALPLSPLQRLTPSFQPSGWAQYVSLHESEGVNSFQAGFKGLEVVFKPSPSVWDGRYANNGWLQELPDPMTKLVWDNAALISPKTAADLGVETEDVIEIGTGGQGKVEAPVYILPGHADDSITVTLGYGRKGVGKVADGAGFDAYSIWAVSMTGVSFRADVKKTGKTYKLASSQNHHSMEGRPIVREGTLDEYKAHPEFAAEMVHMGAEPSMWDEHKYDEGYQWGMTIDLNTCTGCNACAIACQSENNIPIVGKEQVARGREMHWIRLDRYFTGDAENPQAVTQPVACQQCEMAPCEQVCPVAATSHDHEGLNVMTYNRCVGTRYCANNCPYKVRRFNFFNFTNKLDDLIQMAQNPDVTVRSRGVMEKCTYCVQRIVRGKHNAKMENREVRDGEVVSACQAACPAGAIVFGNLNDPNSAVSKSKKEHRKYDLLGELNTRPRTSYLAKIRNPNPELGEG